MRYRRQHQPGGTFFFTVNLRDRSSSVLTDHIQIFRQSVRKCKTMRPFRINAWVILPDHMHCIWTLPNTDGDYSSRWRDIKKRFVKALPTTEFLSLRQQHNNERGIWQKRFWEHRIRDDFDYEQHFNYINWNPVKHGLVKNVRDWPYSTFHKAVAEGIYPLDWCGEDNQNLIAGPGE